MSEHISKNYLIEKLHSISFRLAGYLYPVELDALETVLAQMRGGHETSTEQREAESYLDHFNACLSTILGDKDRAEMTVTRNDIVAFRKAADLLRSPLKATTNDARPQIPAGYAAAAAGSESTDAGSIICRTGDDYPCQSVDGKPGPCIYCGLPVNGSRNEGQK